MRTDLAPLTLPYSETNVPSAGHQPAYGAVAPGGSSHGDRDAPDSPGTAPPIDSGP